MMPVLPPDTYVFGNSWYKKLEAGDVIVFLHDGLEKIKRIEKVDHQNLHVEGDHKMASTDSRHFGWIDSSQVLAKIIWPRAPKNRADIIQD